MHHDSALKVLCSERLRDHEAGHIFSSPEANFHPKRNENLFFWTVKANLLEQKMLQEDKDVLSFPSIDYYVPSKKVPATSFAEQVSETCEKIPETILKSTF